MLNVMEAFGVSPHNKVKGDLGVEIEVEGINLPDPRTTWRRDMDGSLRGESAEYVLKVPLSLKRTRNALALLDKYYKVNETEVFESVRTGVHVHVNVQELTVVELFTFITAYLVLEDLLVNYCGEYREGNLFCLRVKDADYLLYMLEQVVKSKNFYSLGNDILRYSSMNVVALHKYGSLEFRAMRGTKDLDMIGDWAELLLNLRKQAVKFSDPAELFNWIGTNGTESFLELFLGDLKGKLCNGKDVNTYVQDGLNRTHCLALDTDWGSFKELKVEEEVVEVKKPRIRVANIPQGVQPPEIRMDAILGEYRMEDEPVHVDIDDDGDVDDVE